MANPEDRDIQPYHQDGTDTSPVRMLVAEDYRPLAQVMTWAAQSSGYETRTCYDGHSAVEIANAFRPQVIILDLIMPGMDGFEACKALRKNPDHSGAYILAYSAWGNDDVKHKAMEAGFDEHESKSVSFHSILSKVDHRLELGKPATG